VFASNKTEEPNSKTTISVPILVMSQLEVYRLHDGRGSNGDRHRMSVEVLSEFYSSGFRLSSRLSLCNAVKTDMFFFSTYI
jgi:hypothetical protein